MKRKIKRAASLMEYAIILGIVSTILIAMNVYIKRGLQGRIADMSDYFISPKHLDEVTSSNSLTSTNINTDISDQMYIGGGTNLALFDNRQVVSTTNAEDDTSDYFAPYIPSREGYTNFVDRPENEDFIPPELEDECGQHCEELDREEFEAEWRRSADIDYLRREQIKYRSLAAKYRDVVYGIDDGVVVRNERGEIIEDDSNDGTQERARQMYRETDFGCEGSSACRRARNELGLQAVLLCAKSLKYLSLAVLYDREAELIQYKINSLENPDFAPDISRIHTIIADLNAISAKLDNQAIVMHEHARLCCRINVGPPPLLPAPRTIHLNCNLNCNDLDGRFSIASILDYGVYSCYCQNTQGNKCTLPEGECLSGRVNSCTPNAQTCCILCPKLEAESVSLYANARTFREEAQMIGADYGQI